MDVLLFQTRCRKTFHLARAAIAAGAHGRYSRPAILVIPFTTAMLPRLRAVAACALAIAAAGCVPPLVHRRAAADPAIFAAVVAYYRAGAEGQLRVDPRPVGDTMDWREFRLPDPSPVEPLLTARAAVLHHMHVRETRMRAEETCVLALGTPPAEPPSDHMYVRPRSEHPCVIAGPFTAVIVARARPSADGGEWRVTAGRYTTWSYEVRAFRLRKDPRGRFVIVGSEVLTGVMS